MDRISYDTVIQLINYAIQICSLSRLFYKFIFSIHLYYPNTTLHETLIAQRDINRIYFELLYQKNP